MKNYLLAFLLTALIGVVLLIVGIYTVQNASSPQEVKRQWHETDCDNYMIWGNTQDLNTKKYVTDRYVSIRYLNGYWAYGPGQWTDGKWCDARGKGMVADHPQEMF